jgi:signal transduction histidine kinase
MQTPLTVIKGYADQLAWAHEQAEPLMLEESLAAIQRQVEHLRKLARDLLDHTAADLRQLCLQVHEIPFSEVVEELLTDLAVAHGREIQRQVTPGLWVRGDRVRLEQVVRNLLDNACKYSPADTPVRVTLQPRGDEVALAVSDQGEGISADELPHLFDPFYRAVTVRDRLPHGGFGLGLALCRQLVLQHQGVIDVESAPGAGSTFNVRLPRFEPQG